MAGRRSRSAPRPPSRLASALLEHRGGGVGEARIDVAEGLQIEERRGVIDIVEHIGGGLVDRRRARAGRRIGRRAGMDGQRLEAEARAADGIFGHSDFLRLLESMPVLTPLQASSP